MNFLQRLFKRGVSHAPNSKGRKRIQLVNTISLFGMASTFIFFVMNLIQGWYRPMIGLMAACGICSIIYLLNGSKSLQKQRLARLLLIVSTFIFYFANANFLFVGKLSEFFYLFTMIITMLLIDSLRFQIIVFCICLVSFYVPNYFYQHYSDDVFGYANMSILFISIFWLIRQIIELNEQNETKLEKDKQTILEQKKQIEEFNQLKSQFFTDLSHEIRTPLTLLQGYTESLIQSQSISNREQQRKFQIIREQGETINSLLSNILGLSKIENQAFGLNTQLTSLNNFLDAIKSRFIFLFEEKQIVFYLKELKEQVSIDIDSQLFEHAIANLLTNALKHTPKNGEISLQVEKSLDQLHIKVIDNGKGIPSEYLNQIFERYFQVSQSTISQGMGIGLSYTKRIMQAHGFDISVESKPNVKTCFTIAIPMDKVVTEKSIDDLNEEFVIGQDGKPLKTTFSSEKDSTLNKPKILIAEDNIQMQEFLATLLKGYQLTFAKNGKGALTYLSKEVFDVLISDYAMPVMDGEALVEKVKSLNLQIPIIVLTARADNKSKRKMLRLGIDSYLTKPFLQEELLHQIEKATSLMANISKQQSQLNPQDQKFINDHAAMFNQDLNQFIGQNMRSHDFSVETIAAHFNISKSTLNRRVKSLLGQTTKQIIMEARLQKARELFSTMPHAKHKEVAEAVGIKNSTYLNELMEKRFGERP